MCSGICFESVAVVPLIVATCGIFSAAQSTFAVLFGFSAALHVYWHKILASFAVVLQLAWEAICEDSVIDLQKSNMQKKAWCSLSCFHVSCSTSACAVYLQWFVCQQGAVFVQCA